MQTLLQDLKYGVRMLARAPGFTAVAVLTLALGIGANTAIFSVVKAVLLRALPFKNSERLVVVRENVKNHGPSSVAYATFQDWEKQAQSFDQMAGYSDAEFIVSGASSSERIYGEEVTHNYFEMLGVSAAKGRIFLSEENVTPMKYPVAMIGYGLWERRFGSDPAIIGKPITLNNARFTIVGVAPKGFLGFSDQSEAWIPVVMRDAAWPAVAKFDFLHSRDVHWLRGLAVLKPGVSLAQAQSEMTTIADGVAAAYPKENRDRGAVVKFAKDTYIGSFRSPLYILLAAVGFVLLIACANVANLILTRTASREREMAIRLALGAGRKRLIRQFITESLLLSTAGALLGFALAEWGLNLLVAALPLTFPTFTHVRLDAQVLAFTCVLMVGTGILIGLLPALAAGRDALNETLKEGAKGSTGLRGRKIGTALVVFEVALALVLLVGAGLLLKSFGRLLNVNPGFQPDHLLTMRFYVPDRVYEGDGKNRFGPALAEKIASVPGVESAAVTFIDPFVWGGFSRGFTLENHPAPSVSEQDSTTYQEIGSNYFRTMGIPIFSGRDFTASDTLDKPRVVMVSEAFARKFYPGENPLGKRIKYGRADSKNPWMEIVGVTGNIKFNSLRQDSSAEPVFYGPLLQSEVIINMSVIVRTRIAPESMIDPLRAAIQKIDPDVPVYNIATIAQRMHEDSAETRSYTVLLALFAALALTLAAIGIYGVMAYAVAQRTHEIGIRLALGAQRNDVFRLVVGRGLWIALIGVAAGLIGTLALTRVLTGLLFEVAPTDPPVLAGVSLALAGVALLACYLPARRAMRVDPIVALRYE
ncbi:MAG: ABC transporter permease [Candidatus Acidiferrales bacterium]